MTIKKVLVVDDEEDIRDLLAITLNRMGLECELAANISQACNSLKHHTFFLCLTDMCLPDGDGIDLINVIQQHYPELPIAVITAFGSVDNAVKTLKAGAFDYVSKPVNVAMLKELVNSAYKLANTINTSSADEMIGQSKAINELKVNLQKLARSQAPVFIHGESGVGKELVAQLTHNLGPRHNNPFIPVNCGAIPSELMESEFFGHKKGSFSGAIEDKQGLFVAANGGTLFLDEVAELPMAMQVKLLRAIQEKAIKPIGQQQEEAVDVRIVSASHKDLLQQIKLGTFRQDLYYRINVIEVRVPTLKERISDIPILIESIIGKIANQLQIEPPVITSQALVELMKYDFPGNVRELENIMERAIAMCENNEITTSDLALPQSNHLQQNCSSKPDNLDDYLIETERDMIIKALDKTKWNRTAAAKLLGISFRALRYRLQKLKID